MDCFGNPRIFLRVKLKRTYENADAETPSDIVCI
jgi:hypothetical protein